MEDWVWRPPTAAGDETAGCRKQELHRMATSSCFSAACRLIAAPGEAGPPDPVSLTAPCSPFLQGETKLGRMFVAAQRYASGLALAIAVCAVTFAAGLAIVSPWERAHPSGLVGIAVLFAVL